MSVNPVQGGSGTAPPEDMDKAKKDTTPPSTVNKIVSIALNGYKDANKARKVMKSAASIADELTTLPTFIVSFVKWSSIFKIVKGLLAVRKFIAGGKKVAKRTDLLQRFFASWSMAKSVKYMVEGIETFGKFMRDFNVLPAAAFAWTKAVGMFFTPATYITTVVYSIKLGQKVHLMNEFNKNTKLAKGDDVTEEKALSSMKRAVKHIKKSRSDLKLMKIITKDCPIKRRTKDIMSRLKSDNAEIRSKATDEGKVMIEKLKGRIRAQVVSHSIETGICVVSSVGSTIALLFPLLIMPVIIIDCACYTVGAINHAFSKFIPTGDIFEDEKPMIYARIYNHINSNIKFVTQKVQNLFTKSAKAA